MIEFEFSRAFDPPAPLIMIEIGGSPAAAYQSILALLDTGSDMTSIPPAVIARLQLPQVNEVMVEAFGGDGVKRRFLRPVVSAHLRLGDPLPSVYVQCMDFEWETPDNAVPEHIVIGRDILNRLILALHGPRLSGRLALPDA